MAATVKAKPELKSQSQKLWRQGGRQRTTTADGDGRRRRRRQRADLGRPRTRRTRPPARQPAIACSLHVFCFTCCSPWLHNVDSRARRATVHAMQNRRRGWMALLAHIISPPSCLMPLNFSHVRYLRRHTQACAMCTCVLQCIAHNIALQTYSQHMPLL